MVPKYIVLHHSLTSDSGTVSWGAIRDWHTGRNVNSPHKWSNIGYHYGIEKIKNHYEILVGRMMLEQGAHTRQNGLNYQSIGVCCVGNFDLKPPNKEVLKLGLKLVSNLCIIFKIHADSVIGHRDVATYKTCPGKMFDLDSFRRDLTKFLPDPLKSTSK